MGFLLNEVTKRHCIYFIWINCLQFTYTWVYTITLQAFRIDITAQYSHGDVNEFKRVNRVERTSITLEEPNNPILKLKRASPVRAINSNSYAWKLIQWGKRAIKIAFIEKTGPETHDIYVSIK